MTRITSLLLLVLFVFGVPVFAGDDLSDLDMKNTRIISDKLITGGQPSKKDLERLKAAGFTTVINLRRDGETTRTGDPKVDAQFNFVEQEIAADVRLNYFHLPISSANDITVENAKLLDEVLRAAPGPVLLHCASGNRAGALMALRAFHVQGKSAEEALAIGKAAGLTGLEPTVKASLGIEN